MTLLHDPMDTPVSAALSSSTVSAASTDRPASMTMMAVLVLFRCLPAESACLQSLAPQVEQLPQHLQFRLLLCENEASINRAPLLPDWIEYQPRAENAGLAWAYNAGLQEAMTYSVAWLLTLDQDTTLPETFLQEMFAHAAALTPRTDIAAIVPELVSRSGEIYSPFLAKIGYESALPAGFKGVARGDVRAFNSAALLRVAWLAHHGGYDQRFWLDFLDHATFRAIARSGARVWVAGDIKVEHHLSLTEGRSSMSGERFRNFLDAEAASIDIFGTRKEEWLHTLRLLGRLVSQRRRNDPKAFTQHTKTLLRRRLRMSRKSRIEQWQDSLRTEKPWMIEPYKQ